MTRAGNMVGSDNKTHGKPGSGANGSGAVGLLNRLPADSYTAKVASHLHDLKDEERRARDDMRMVLDSLGAGFWDWDIPSLQVWYASHVRDLLGYDQDDALWNENIFRKLIHPDDEAKAEEIQNSVLLGGADDYRFEARIRHKDGHWVWIEVLGRAVLRAEDGTPLRIAGMFVGIDQRKREQADAEFLTSLTQELLTLSDADAIRRTAIRRLGQYLGADRVSFGRLDGKTRSLIIRHDWRGADIPSLAGAWPAPSGKPIEHYFEMMSRKIVCHDTSDDPMIDAELLAILTSTETAAFVSIPLMIDGKHRGFVGVSHAAPRIWQDHEVRLIESVASRLWDSILRARAEERSRADQSLLKLALRMAKLGAREKDYATGLISESENFYEVIGHRNAAMMTVEEYLSHVHPEDRDSLRATLAQPRHKRGDEAITHEHRMITADENIRHIVLTAQYHGPKRSDRKPSGYSSIFVQDVTAERQREQAAASASSQLLKQSRLSAMGVMASTLAHELNQPLATAANYLSLVEALTIDDPSKTSEDVQEYLARALSKVLEAGEIIRRIRSFTADGEVKRSRQSLRDLVYRALSSLFGRAGAEGVTIINSVPPAIMVDVEPLLIEHSIANIIRNAGEALAGQVNPCINIDACLATPDVNLLIRDNGPGMHAELASNIFNPFVSTKDQGTGLGLAISRTMVEASGGKMSLKSSRRGETVFCLCLPLAPNE